MYNPILQSEESYGGHNWEGNQYMANNELLSHGQVGQSLQLCSKGGCKVGTRKMVEQVKWGCFIKMKIEQIGSLHYNVVMCVRHEKTVRTCLLSHGQSSRIYLFKVNKCLKSIQPREINHFNLQLPALSSFILSEASSYLFLFLAKIKFKHNLQVTFRARVDLLDR